jgi:tetratricopeptide (TPR) repeat protein
MIGGCHARLGDHEQARDYCESALALCRRHGDVFGQADSLENLAAIAKETGERAQALTHYEQALVLWHDLDNTYRQAGALTHIGDLHADLEHPEDARHAWRRAVELYRRQKLHAAATRVEERLARASKTVTAG